MITNVNFLDILLTSPQYFDKENMDKIGEFTL